MRLIIYPILKNTFFVRYDTFYYILRFMKCIESF
jgi:hypothetical protein